MTSRVRVLTLQVLVLLAVAVTPLLAQSNPAWYPQRVPTVAERLRQLGVTPRVDEVGNTIVTLGSGSPHILIATSGGPDGYMVSDITPDGYLRLHRITTAASFRLFDQFLYGQPVEIQTTTGQRVAGVVGSMSAHLQRGREMPAAARTLDDIWVDVGASSAAEVEALGIRLLDPVTLPLGYHSLSGHQMVRAGWRSLDDALFFFLARQDPPHFTKLPQTGTITIAWTAQGAFGNRGLSRLARALKPDRVILLATPTLGKDADPRGTIGQLGAGPIVAEGSALLAAAQQAGIRLQTGTTPRVPALWPAAVTEVVSLPVLFAQTPVEITNFQDRDALVSLLRALAGVPDGQPPPGVVGGGGSRERPAPPPLTHLAPLVEVYGVSGHETPVREEVQRRLPKWAKPVVDAKGNLTVSFGEGGQELLFVAHTDELGCEITEIREDGMASVRRCGLFNASMEGHPVLVHTAAKRIPAVMAPRPGYMRATEWQPKAEEMAVYFGTDTKAATEALGVKPGDTVTVEKQFRFLGMHRATARSIDDRAGCAALLSALERIDPSKVKNRVTFAWDVEEETGLLGAGVLAERMQPRVVFPVDTFVSSDTPIDPQRYARIPLGSGAVLRAADSSSITPPETVAKVKAMAAARGIPVSVGVTSGGNDGSQFTKVGSIVMPLSWPGRYSHSAVEVIDGRDLQALIDLIVLLATEWK